MNNIRGMAFDCNGGSGSLQNRFATWQGGPFELGSFTMASAGTIQGYTPYSGSVAGGAITILGGNAVGTNSAGGAINIRGGTGTGNAGGGSIVFQTAPAGSSGTTAGTLATRLTIDSTGASTFTGSVAIGSGTAITKVISAAASLDFASTAAQNSSELTITVTGAADGDVVALGVPNASTNTNSTFTARVSAADTVTVKFNNYSAGAIDPTSGTFRATVIKH